MPIEKILADNPETTGSLGIAISEAIERAASDDQTKYALGSVLNHVKLHQTIVGQEAIKQMEKAGNLPDIVIAPFGGGSNFAGLSFPFLRLNFDEGKKIRCIASEPASCPKLTRGEFRYDFGDTGGMTPLLPMYTLGHNFVPAPIHAGGLRYHGAGVIVSQLLRDKLIEAVAHDNIEVFEAGIKFAQAEMAITKAQPFLTEEAQAQLDFQMSKAQAKDANIQANKEGVKTISQAFFEGVESLLNADNRQHQLMHQDYYGTAIPRESFWGHGTSNECPF